MIARNAFGRKPEISICRPTAQSTSRHRCCKPSRLHSYGSFPESRPSFPFDFINALTLFNACCKIMGVPSQSMDHILSIVLFTPLAGLLVLLLIPSRNAHAVKVWANIASFIGFLVSLPLVFQFDRSKDYQFVEQANWIPSIGASYHLGIDGFALLLVMLTTLLGFLSILSSWSAI